MTRVIRVLELRSVRGTGGGPEKTILLGAARSDPARFAVTVCYIRDLRDHIFDLHARATALGVDYHEIQERHSFDPSIWPALRRLVRERRIDIVHAHEYKTDALALLLARAERVVPLATVHGWTGHAGRERWLYYPVDRRLLAWFPRIVAVSREIRTTLVRAGVDPARIRTVLNGIDHRAVRRDRAQQPAVRAELGLAPGETVIGAVGRLEPQKRLDLLLEAFAMLRQRRAGLRLCIAGDGSERHALERRAERLGLSRTACRFLGHRPDIVRLHHAFDLFVQASSYEGTSNAVLEAMALETPVVATGVGGTGELLRHEIDGLIVPARDVRALAAAIDSTLDHRDVTRRRVAFARLRIEHELSFDTRMRAIEQMYLALAAAGRTGLVHRAERVA